MEKGRRRESVKMIYSHTGAARSSHQPGDLWTRSYSSWSLILILGGNRKVLDKEPTTITGFATLHSMAISMAPIGTGTGTGAVTSVDKSMSRA